MADETKAATKRVAGTVTNLVVTRDREEVNGKRVDIMKVEWKNPAYLFDQDRADHATWLDSNIDFMRENCKPTSGQVWADAGTLPPEGGLLLEYTGFDYNWVKGINQTTSYEKPFDRNRFHPVQPGKYCRSVQVRIHGGNDSGVGGWDPDDRQASGRGPDAAFNYYFEQPDIPNPQWVGVMDGANYAIEYRIPVRYTNPKADDDKSPNEIYDTVYALYRQDNLPSSGYSKRKALQTNWVVPNDGNEYTNSVAVDHSFLSISEGQWIVFSIEAYNRGMWGDSRKVRQDFCYGWPQRAVVTGIAVSSMDNTTGIITVKSNIPSDFHRPTTKAKLQRLRDVAPDLTADEVQAGTFSWEDVTDMAQIDMWDADQQEGRDATYSIGFVDSVSEARPSGPNLRTWYRIVTENDLPFSSAVNCKSRPFEARQLYREETAANAQIHIEKLATNEDATAVKALLGWPDDTGSTKTDGTEVSWSVHPDAWESSEQPSTALVTWKDDATKGEYDNSASFTIYGVEQGQTVYVKARRYRNGSDGEVAEYGPYATGEQAYMFPFIPAMPPTDVNLSAPTYVPRGSDISLTWTFQSEAPQTAWVAYKVVDGEKTAVASGEDAYGACTIPAAMLEGDGAELVVSITTGSEWAESNQVSVSFADPPSIAAALPSSGSEDDLPIIMEQPFGVYCSSDTGDDLLRVRVVSHGVVVDKPDGSVTQLMGDVVFDAYVAPEWSAGSDGLFYTVVDLPEGLDIHDVGIYDVEVTAVNETTGLQSETQTTTARVRWAHQAHQPGDGSTVEVDNGARVAVITPQAPDNAVETDVFDLYRVTPDKAYLIAEGVRFGSSVSDVHAPYGRAPLTYRICTRTSDGDLSWRDVDYTLKCDKLRFDFGNMYIELPYNVVREDSWSKDFEERRHLDGKVGGAWNAAVSRSASLSTDLVRFTSDADQRLVRDLATYPGPVFVRLPNGCAYQANVDVSGLSESYDSRAVSTSFSATEVALTDEYKVATSEIMYPGAEEEQPSYTSRAILSWGAARPATGGKYSLPAAASSARVKLSTSYDSYTNEWTVPSTVSGKTVTLGTFPSDLVAYLSEVPQDALVMLACDYTVEA